MEAGPARRAAGPRCWREGGQRGCVGRSRGPRRPSAGRPVTDLAALGRRRRQRDRESGEGGFKGRRGLQVDGLKGRRGRRVEVLMRAVPSASRARHRCKEPRRGEESSRCQNRCRCRTPARAQASSRSLCFRTDLLSLDRGGGSCSPPSSRAGPACQSSAGPSCDASTLTAGAAAAAGASHRTVTGGPSGAPGHGHDDGRLSLGWWPGCPAGLAACD